MAGHVSIKICGVRSPEIAQVCVEAGADMIGLVFVPESPRYVTMAEAQQIARCVQNKVRIVGVFRSQTVEEVVHVARTVPLNVVQLHGRWPAEHLPRTPAVDVVCAISFDPSTIEQSLHDWQTRYQSAELAAVMIDTPDPAKLGGGTGHAFDWPALRRALDHVKPAMPMMLAGGLTPQNVAEAIHVVRPWGVDVSSGVESSRGVKDGRKILDFCRAVRLAAPGGEFLAEAS